MLNATGLPTRGQTAVPAADLPGCKYCKQPILPDDATDESGTLHAEPCAGEYATYVEDMLVDAARDRELMRSWGSRA